MNTPTRVQYHPNGYRELGLAPITINLPYRDGADTKKLKTQLERWERRHGNPAFEARNLHKVKAPLAYELVNVYVSLREHFPQVRADFIDFAGADQKNTLAMATNYGSNMPTVRDLVANYDDVDPIDTDMLVAIARAENADEKVIRMIRSEASLIAGGDVRDPSATGSIEFGDVFLTKKSYQKLLDFWAMRNQRALNRGLPVRTLEGAVSAASFTLIHEFGHLVEAELHEQGYRPTERVYRTLSEIVLGVDNPSDRQWRYHLINFPSYSFTDCKGPEEGGPVRRRANKKALHLPIRELLGSYAATYRDELFAEAFAHTFGGARKLRETLRPFKTSLREQGLGIARRPSR